MSYDDARTQILLSGLHDWVSLHEARSLVRRTSPAGTSPADIRAATLSVIEDLLRGDLVVAGDLTAGFARWPGSSDEVMQRITANWTNLDEAEWLGIGWLANTPAGNAFARPVWDALPERTDE